MILGPELYEIEDIFTKVVIKPTSTYIVCKNPEAVKQALESYEVGTSHNYYIVTEVEAVVRGL